ncbi:MAG: YfhO family protein [Chloroflexia bacterium]
MQAEATLEAAGSRARHRTLAGALEVGQLVLLPLLISFAMMWRALLGLEVFAPTDVVAGQDLIAERPPGWTSPDLKNPLLGDVVDTFIPWRLYARSEIAAGRFPLWDSYNLLGTHFHANLQSQIFSPFNVLWLVLPPVWGLGAITALKWTLGGLGIALLLRRLGLGMPAAIFGAVAFQLSGPMVAWLQWPISEGLVWVPWMMWATLGWVDTRGPGWLAALAAFVAAELAAGHIETAFHSLAFVGVFAIVAVFATSRRPSETAGQAPPREPAPDRLRQRLVMLGGLAGAGLVGLGLAAVQLVPFLDVLPESYQWWLRSQPSQHVAGLALPLQGTLMWLTPNGFGWTDTYNGPLNWIEANPYVGAVTLLLAAANIGPGPRGRGSGVRGRLFWGVMAVVAVSMAYGIPPLGWLRELPGFNSSLNWRLVSVAGPCLIVLGAMGLDRLLLVPGRLLPRYWAAAAAGLGLAGVGFLVLGARIWTVSSDSLAEFSQAWRAWAGVLFCAGAVLVLGRMLGWVGARTLAALMIGLLTLDMMRAAWGFNPTNSFDTFYPKSTLLSFAAQRGPTERLAVAGEYAGSNMLVPYGVPDYRMYDATIDNRYLAFTRILSPETFRESFRRQDANLTTHLYLLKPNTAILSAVGIKWVLTANDDDPNGWQPLPADGPPYKRTLTKNGFTIWENRIAQPYTYFASNFSVGADEATVAQSLKLLTVDTANHVQIEDPDRILPAGLSGSAQTAPALAANEGVTLESYEPGEIRIKARAEKTRYLVIDESWDKRWRATIDGQAAAIYRTNYVIQGLVVPPGEHQVTMVYDPPAFRRGLAISAAALLAWLGLVIFAVASKRRKREE